jgi:hypothetical protein
MKLGEVGRNYPKPMKYMSRIGTKVARAHLFENIK